MRDLTAGNDPTVVSTFNNAAAGIPSFAGGSGAAAAWLFDRSSVQWEEADRSSHDRPVVDWQMEMRSKSISTMNIVSDSRCSLTLAGAARGKTSWNGTAPYTVRESQFRLSRFGRVGLWSGQQYSCPMNLTIKVKRKFYVIPDLWVQFSSGGEIAVNSNWKDYAAFYPHTNGSTMEAYAYESGDLTKPVIVRFTATVDAKSASQDVLTSVVVERAITGDIQAVTSFQDEFNWKLAVLRFNVANNNAAKSLEPDGYLGWVGFTDVWTNRFLKPGDINLGTTPDPLIVLGEQDVTCSVKDMYLIDVGTAEEEVEYVQTFTVQNDMDNQQSVKTSDFSWAHTDTSTFSWGMSEQIAVKVVVKWEFEISESVVFASDKIKYAFQFEAGYTHTFTQSWTDTHTDTRTFTMAGQSVTLPSQTAAHVNAVLMKVTATGTLGQAVLISEDPGVVIAPLNGCNQTAISLYDATIDLGVAAKTLGMKSIVPEVTTKTGQKLVGAFAKPTLKFNTKFGASGTASVTPAPYVKPKTGGFEQVSGQAIS